MMTGGHPDLLFQRYFEASLSPYEEQLLSKVLARGGAFADRFLELRELECALALFFGDHVRPDPTGTFWEISGAAGAAAPGCGGPPIAVPNPFRARRFPGGSGPSLEGDCAGEILRAYLRRQRGIAPASHRRAVALSMGLLCGEPRDVLRCRHGSGMSSREISEEFSRSIQGTEELILRTQTFLAGCVRMRLARTG